jgi:hypothetical protein
MTSGINAYGTAQEAVALVAPTAWFEEPHGAIYSPRCCIAIKCVELTLDAVGSWTDADAKSLARAVVRGLAP